MSFLTITLPNRDDPRRKVRRGRTTVADKATAMDGRPLGDGAAETLVVSGTGPFDDDAWPVEEQPRTAIPRTMANRFTFMRRRDRLSGFQPHTTPLSWTHDALIEDRVHALRRVRSAERQARCGSSVSCE